MLFPNSGLPAPDPAIGKIRYQAGHDGTQTLHRIQLMGEGKEYPLFKRTNRAFNRLGKVTLPAG